MSYEVRENGIYVGQVKVPVVFDRGNLALAIRAESKEDFDREAVKVKIKTEVDGVLVPTRGVTITEIGPIYNRETNEVLDSRYHVNVWLGPKVVATNEWLLWAPLWAMAGTSITPNNQEWGAKFQGIELIDMSSIQNPINVLF